jgi:hypothetical protein
MIVFEQGTINKRLPGIVEEIKNSGYTVTEVIEAEGVYDACVSIAGDYDIQICNDGMICLTQWNHLEHDYDYLVESDDIQKVLGGVV